MSRSKGRNAGRNEREHAAQAVAAGVVLVGVVSVGSASAAEALA